MISEALLLTDRLLLALLTGLYQGLLLSAVVWLCLKLSRRANAATRYALWFLTLCVVAALPVVHLVLGMTNSRESAIVRSAGKSADTKTATAQATQAVGQQPETEELAQLKTPDAVSETAEDGVLLDSSETQLPREAIDPAFVFPPQETGGETPTGGEPVTTAELPALKRFQPLTLPLTPLAGAIIICAIAVLSAGRLFALTLQLISLGAMRRASAPAPDWLEHRFKLLARRLGLKRRVELRVSDEIHSPMVLGFLPSAVVVPESLLATPDPARLDPLFRHELAHVSRFDDWLNLGQQAIKAFFGFHPAVLWISRRICTEREIACDDFVLQGGQKPRDYALLLTEFASRDRGRAWSAAPAAWSRKSQLSERVNMILRTDRSTSPRLGRTHLGVVTAGIAGCLIVLFAFAPRMTLGREPAAIASNSGDASTVAPARAEVTISSGDGLAAAECATTTVLIGDTPAVVAVPRAANAARPLGSTAPALAPGTVVYVHSQDGSIEERLQRVELLLEKLLSEKSGPMHGMYAPAQPRAVTPRTPRPGAGFPMVAPEPAPMPEELHLKEDRDLARRDAKARAGAGRVAEREWKLKRGTAELMRERQALEARRQALEAQIAALEAQLERLESEQEKVEEERERLEEQRQEQEHEHDEEHQHDHDNHDDEHQDKEKQ